MEETVSHSQKKKKKPVKSAVLETPLKNTLSEVPYGTLRLSLSTTNTTARHWSMGNHVAQPQDDRQLSSHLQSHFSFA